MFLNIYEILDMVLMTLIVGYIFMSSFRPHRAAMSGDEVLDRYMRKSRRGFDWDAFWFAASVTAPTIIFHELGHKIVALSFGLQSTFHAACSTSAIATGGFLDFYCGLNILAVVLKTLGVGFLFFVPGYVQTVGATVGQHIWIALAGPLINLAFFITAWALLRNKKLRLRPKTIHYLALTKNVNLFLFVFNILPIPGFDGFSVFAGLAQLLF